MIGETRAAKLVRIIITLSGLNLINRVNQLEKPNVFHG